MCSSPPKRRLTLLLMIGKEGWDRDKMCDLLSILKKQMIRNVEHNSSTWATGKVKSTAYADHNIESDTSKYITFWSKQLIDRRKTKPNSIQLRLVMYNLYQMTSKKEGLTAVRSQDETPVDQSKINFPFNWMATRTWTSRVAKEQEKKICRLLPQWHRSQSVKDIWCLPLPFAWGYTTRSLKGTHHLWIGSRVFYVRWLYRPWYSNFSWRTEYVDS